MDELGEVREFMQFHLDSGGTLFCRRSSLPPATPVTPGLGSGPNVLGGIGIELGNCSFFG
jgi:hypothetical protein